MLSFNFSSSVNNAKDFFTEWKDVKLPNLVEVGVYAVQANVNSAVSNIAKTVKSVGGP